MHRSRIIAYLHKRLESLPRLRRTVLNRSRTVSSRPKPPSLFPFLRPTIYDAHHLSMVHEFIGLDSGHEMIYIIPQRPIMRYPAQHKQQTRQRIVRAALRRFRSRGTEGATIGTLMPALRLTHGGSYTHVRI